MNPQAIEAMLQQWSALNKSDRFVFQKLLQFLDGRNIQTGTVTGTMFGTAPNQKVGFHGTAPVVQPAEVVLTGGGATIDTNARTAILAIIAVLHNNGLTA